MSDYDINVSTDRLKEIEGIVADAFDRMGQSAKTIGAQGELVSVAYRGSGTNTAVDSYTNLAGAGRALSEALQGLKDDLNLTGETGHETDARVQEAMNRGASSVALGMQA